MAFDEPSFPSGIPLNSSSMPDKQRSPFISVDHLSTEALAAFVDDELTATALQRAYKHLSQCERCRQSVAQQAAAQERLRTSGEIRIPAHLLGQLSRIPHNQQPHRSRLLSPQAEKFYGPPQLNAQPFPVFSLAEDARNVSQQQQSSRRSWWRRSGKR